MERFFWVRKTEDRPAGLRAWEELSCSHSHIVEVVIFYLLVLVRGVMVMMCLLVYYLDLFVVLW
jgi:hypothetical protein